MREWLGSLRPAPKQVPVAVFDTRVDKPRWLVGSAALGAQKLLQRCGGLPLVPPTSFFVDITKEATVLSEGEQERAEAWGADLGTMLVADGGS